MGLSLGLGIAVNKKDFVSSDFTPSDLGSTLVLWYKNGTDITQAEGGEDGEPSNRFMWLDQSGNSRHAYQDTTANQPGTSGGGLNFEEDTTPDFMHIMLKHLTLVMHLEVI